MGIKAFGEKELAKFSQCKTQDDYRGFVKELGYELSDADLDAVCGGLSGLGNEAALNALAQRLDGAIAKDGMVFAADKAQRVIVK